MCCCLIIQVICYLPLRTHSYVSLQDRDWVCINVSRNLHKWGAHTKICVNMRICSINHLTACACWCCAEYRQNEECNVLLHTKIINGKCDTVMVRRRIIRQAGAVHWRIWPRHYLNILRGIWQGAWKRILFLYGQLNVKKLWSKIRSHHWQMLNLDFVTFHT